MRSTLEYLKAIIWARFFHIIHEWRHPDIWIYVVLYADDLRLWGKVKLVFDAIRVQKDLDALSEWCKLNHFDLNIDKYEVMSFFRIRSPVHFQYSIDGIYTRPRGVDVWTTHFRSPHVKFITSKAYSMLGFVKLSQTQLSEQVVNVKKAWDDE